MTARENISSHCDDSEHSNDVFMAESNEEDADENETLSYFK